MAGSLVEAQAEIVHLSGIGDLDLVTLGDSPRDIHFGAEICIRTGMILPRGCITALPEHSVEGAFAVYCVVDFYQPVVRVTVDGELLRAWSSEPGRYTKIMISLD